MSTLAKVADVAEATGIPETGATAKEGVDKKVEERILQAKVEAAPTEGPTKEVETVWTKTKRSML